MQIFILLFIHVFIRYLLYYPVVIYGLGKKGWLKLIYLGTFSRPLLGILLVNSYRIDTHGTQGLYIKQTSFC